MSLDLDVVVAFEDIDGFSRMLEGSFVVSKFRHSVNVSLQGSDLRVRIRIDPRYAEFVQRAQPREVLERRMPVAEIGDVLKGKIWAALDPERRSSKRQKDLADIARIIEAYTALRASVPAGIISRLF